MELEAYGADSETAALLRDQLSRPRAEALPFTMTRARYLSAIVPSDEQMEKVTPGAASISKSWGGGAPGEGGAPLCARCC